MWGLGFVDKGGNPRSDLIEDCSLICGRVFTRGPWYLGLCVAGVSSVFTGLLCLT